MLLFDVARLEIRDNRKKILSWLMEPVTLYFLKNKKEVFEIKVGKDGYSPDTLRDICNTINELSLPVYQA